ncbi:MAG: hypothetical protein ACKOFU_07540 [Actinomycetota bacterium]
MKTSTVALWILAIFVASSSPAHSRVDNYGNPIPEGSVAYTFDSGSLDFHPARSWSSSPGRASGQSGIQVSLPLCEKDSSDCISQVNYIDDSGKTVSGKLDSYLPITWDGFFAGCEGNICAPKTPPWKYSTGKIALKEDLERRIPLGSKPSIWTFPGLRHPGGNKYLVSAVFQGIMSNQSAPLERGSAAIWAGGAVNIEVSPVIVDEDADWNSIDAWAKSYAIPETGLWNQFNLWCFPGKEKDDLYCVRRVEDATPRTLEVTAKLDLLKDAFASHGFMISRTANARVTTERRANTIEVSFAGSTSSVPSAVGYLPRNEFGYREMIKAAKSVQAETGALLDLSKGRPYPEDENDLSGLQNWVNNASGVHTDGSMSGAIASWISLEKATKFKSIRTSSVWFFRSVGLLSTDFEWLTSCKRELGVSGVVSSNATVMKPTPPKWNAKEQSLEFKIASPHLDESGKVAGGFYKLSISREVATCLWGKDAVSARATISVVSQDGQEKIFTSSFKVGERYLDFQVAGFTYSANTIRIRLEASGTSAKSSEVNPKTTSTTVKESVTEKVQTITCIQGKTIKKVSTKTCPKGFKKR